MAVLLSIEEQERRLHDETVHGILEGLTLGEWEGFHMVVSEPSPVKAKPTDATSLYEWRPSRGLSRRRHAGRCQGLNVGRNIYYRD